MDIRDRGSASCPYVGVRIVLPWLQDCGCDGRETMLIFSMGVSVNGFISDRAGRFGWIDPTEEQFRFRIAQVRELGAYLCGRRLYETMLVWETDPAMRNDEPGGRTETHLPTQKSGPPD